MPTIPAGDRPHEVREVAESFGSDAERYDRTRPSYPEALIERIVRASPGRDVLDVGCGTGIVARGLQAAGCRVLGVDADARMAEAARRSGLEVEVSRFEDWDPAGRRFDAIVAGQSWHWVDPFAGAARAAAALRPGGRLAVFWNVQQPADDVATAFGEVLREVSPDLPFYKTGMDAYATILGGAADGMRAAGAFGAPEEWSFDWERAYTRDEWLDLLPTFGGHSRLPLESRRALLAGMGAAIDALGGSFTMGYRAVVVTAAA